MKWLPELSVPFRNGYLGEEFVTARNQGNDNGDDHSPDISVC
jgi:hypothetical protein